jgi:hypothetical protein
MDTLRTVWRDITGTALPETIAAAIRSIVDDDKEP